MDQTAEKKMVRMFTPGDEVAGCVVTGDGPLYAHSDHAVIRLVCPCQVQFAATVGTVAAAERRRQNLTCPGCAPPAPPPPVGPLSHKDLSVRDVILLAALDLSVAGNSVFSEWDLTVAAWSLNRKMFGMPGYEQSYPNHKRVSVELVATRPGAPVFNRYLTRVRPSFYTLTALGRKNAEHFRSRLRSPQPITGT